MRLKIVLLALGAVCAFSSAVFAQSPPAASSTKPVSPIQTQFKAFKVNFGKDGKEELEPASDVSPGDVLEYVALHRNASQRRLLNVDFAIPIPWGTTLWQGSVKPSDGKLVLAAQEPKDAKSKERAKVVWRVEQINPGQSVELKLRVSIDPDPTLAPAKPVNPFAPRVPELRKP